MALTLGELVVDLVADTKGLVKGEREVKNFSQRTAKNFSVMGKALAAAVSVEATRRLLVLADNMKVLERRLVRFTGSAKSARKTMEALVGTANDVGAEIQTTVGIFERFSLIREEIGASNDEILQMTDTLAKLGAIGGSSAQEISNSLVQLSQGLAGGVLRAEEFNSIIENTPEIAKAIGREMGLSMGELRGAMLEGELTSEAVFEAIKSAAEETNKTFEKLPVSITKAAQALQNNLIVAVSNLDTQLGASAAFSQFTQDLADMVRLHNEAANAANKQAQVEKRIDEIIGKRINTRGRLVSIRSKEAAELDKLLADRIELEEKLTTRIKTSGRRTKKRSEEDKAATQVELNNTNARIKALIRESKAAAEVFRLRTQGLPEVADTSSKKPVDTKTDDALGGFDDEIGFTLAEEAGAKEFEAKLEAKRKEGADFLTLLQSQNATELELIEANEVAKIDKAAELFEAGKLSAQQYQDALTEIQEKGQQERSDLQAAQAQMMLAATSSAFSALGNLAKDAEGQQTKTSKKMFALSKGFAVAEAAVAMGQNMANASKIGFPQNIPMIAGAITQGVNIANIISSAKVGGGRARGGSTSPIMAHPVNEGDTPELLEQAGRQFLLPNGKGGTVSPLNGGGAGGGMSGNISVSIISNGEPQVITGTSITSQQVAIMIDNANKEVIQEINSSLATGRGDTARSMKQGFNVENNLRG